MSTDRHTYLRKSDIQYRSYIHANGHTWTISISHFLCCILQVSCVSSRGWRHLRRIILDIMKWLVTLCSPAFLLEWNMQHPHYFLFETSVKVYFHLFHCSPVVAFLFSSVQLLCKEKFLSSIRLLLSKNCFRHCNQRLSYQRWNPCNGE